MRAGDLQKITVKVHGKEKGTGILYPAPNDKYVYLFTARHTVDGRDALGTATSYDTITIYCYNPSSDKTDSLYNIEPIRILRSENQSDDVVIIVLEKESITPLIGEIPIYDMKNHMTLIQGNKMIFGGFPRGANSGEAFDMDDKCTYKEIKDTHKFQFDTTKDYTDRTKEEEDGTSATTSQHHVSGYSGAGVFYNDDNHLFLVGILIQYRESGNTCFGIDIGKYQEILTKFGYNWYQEKLTEIPHHEINQSQITDIAGEFQRQLDNERNARNCYQPKTALSRLEGIEEAISDSSLSRDEKKKYLAVCHFLKGLVYLDLEEKRNSQEYFLKAYNHNKNKNEYKSYVATLYQRNDEKEKALSLANEILEIEEDNARANFVKKAIDETFLVSEKALSNKLYKTLYMGHISSFKSIEKVIDYGKQLFKNELNTTNEIPQFITMDDVHYWHSIAYLLIMDVLIRFPNNTIILDYKNYQNNPQLLRAQNIYNNIIDSIKEESKELTWFLQMKFWFYYCSYLLTESRESVIKMYELVNFKLLTHTNKEYFLHTTSISLKQINELDKALEIDNLSKNEYTPINKAITYQQKRDFSNAILHYKEYFSTQEKFCERDIQFMAFMIENVKHMNQNTDELYSTFFSTKPFENELTQKFVKASCLASFENRHSEVLALLNEIVVLIEGKEEYLNIKWFVCVCFFSIKKYSNVIDLVTNYFPNYKNHITHLSLVIEACIFSTENSILLAELLLYWRENNYPIKEIFTQQEINIYLLSHNTPKLLEVAKYAMETFGDSKHFYKANYIIALWENNPNDKLLATYLDDSVLHLDLSYEQMFRIGQIAIDIGENKVGVELIYKATSENLDDFNLLAAYLVEINKAVSFYNENYGANRSISNGDYISIKVDQQTQIIEVNAKVLKSNLIIKEIANKKIKQGESIDINDNGKLRKITLLRIYDKYQGLSAKILNDAKNENILGAPITSFTLDTTKDLAFQMMRLFGGQGDERQQHINRLFTEYYNYSCSFSELVYGTQQFPLDIYHTLRLEKKDFRVFPRILYQNYIDNGINMDFDFVIDFTTIFPLMILSEHYEIRPNKKKFLIAPLMIIIIKNEILKTNEIDENGMSLNISSNNFFINSPSKEGKKARLKYLQSILDWIEEFCIIEYAVNNLDILRKIKDDGLHILNDLYFHYMLESAGLYLRESTYFLSEDNNPLMKQIGRIPISLEMYLLELHPKIYDNELLPQLINLNHKGLLINLQSLKNLFKQGLDIDSNELFWMYIDNLKLLTNGKNIDTTLNFIHYVYSLSLNIKFQSSISRKILRIVLPAYIKKHYEATNQLIQISILSKFRLMGEKKDCVILDFKTVIEEILNQ